MHDDKNIKIVNSFIADDGSTISNPQEVVDHFNDYFVNIGNTQAATIPPFSTQHVFQSDRTFINSFVFYPTGAYEIVQIANGLQDKISFSIDCILTNIMKLTIPYISVVISALVNCSFRIGNFPNELKIAKVCTIFRAGPHKFFSNYRPISVLPCFSKIFEKAAYNRIQRYLNTSNMIENNQFRFRRDHSAYMAILGKYDYLT